MKSSSDVVFIGGAGDDSVDGCIDGGINGLGWSVEFMLNAI